MMPHVPFRRVYHILLSPLTLEICATSMWVVTQICPWCRHQCMVGPVEEEKGPTLSPLLILESCASYKWGKRAFSAPATETAFSVRERTCHHHHHWHFKCLMTQGSRGGNQMIDLTENELRSRIEVTLQNWSGTLLQILCVQQSWEIGLERMRAEAMKITEPVFYWVSRYGVCKL